MKEVPYCQVTCLRNSMELLVSRDPSKVLQSGLAQQLPVHCWFSTTDVSQVGAGTVSFPLVIFCSS